MCQYTPLITSLSLVTTPRAGCWFHPLELLHACIVLLPNKWKVEQLISFTTNTKGPDRRPVLLEFFLFLDDCTLNLIAFPKASQSLSSLCFSLTLQVFHGVGHGLPDGVPSVQSLHLSLWNPVHGLLGVSSNSLPGTCADSVISHSAVSKS